MLKKVRLVVLSLTLVVVCLVCNSKLLLAQEPEIAIDPIATQIQQLQNTYRQALTDYRNDERGFVIAREQYGQLGTLSALEDAVQATRRVMLSRINVLDTYLLLLKLTLLQTTGVELSVKQRELDGIDSLLAKLSLQKGKVESSADRKKIAERVTEFVPLAAETELRVYSSLTFITYGHMQAIFDKVNVVKAEVQKYVEDTEKNPLRLGEKRRGFDEVDRNLESVKTHLQQVKSEIEDVQQESSQGSYEDVVDEMNIVFADLSRTINFLYESTRP